MAEHINREKTINEFAIRSSFYDAEWGNKRFTPDDVEEILRSIPAADVRPVVRERWIEKGGIWECPECKAAYKARLLYIKPNFCPNCGADMREPWVRFCPNCGADIRETCDGD